MAFQIPMQMKADGLSDRQLHKLVRKLDCLDCDGRAIEQICGGMFDFFLL